MYCPKCNYKNADDARFCSVCGESLAMAHNMQQTQQNTYQGYAQQPQGDYANNQAMSNTQQPQNNYPNYQGLNNTQQMQPPNNYQDASMVQQQNQGYDNSQQQQGWVDPNFHNLPRIDSYMPQNKSDAPAILLRIVTIVGGFILFGYIMSWLS